MSEEAPKCEQCGGCPCKDPKKLENMLKPYEKHVDQIQAMLFWRNPIPMAILLVLVNLLFFIIYKLNLSFVPTMLLLGTIYVLFKVVKKIAGEKIAPILFKPIENKEGTYKIYPLEKVCETISCLVGKISCLTGRVKAGDKPTIGTALIPLAVLSGLFLFFLITGTFWLNFVLVNLILLLPAVIFHPKVLEKIQPYFAKCQKKD
ncbi:hypothetical protein GPJ56_004929 [Histomonas meleagridis]|uniref:uncharacterized protein n=1 Tax=Histomonas meleagridis TaxID=135588 RepID=UPI003559FBEE|nr:hypothetical protein GPJ56_004929 [Histomonas meleagridis]KAH0798545.1 hypothetical protein GO595_008410 [Histomonas meleagridis]